ncbi:hypothetical protein KEM55_002514 [Ascosphaera atra]|nr:hypothetical protein KEM55_002514 [Ascosphaera atra]
MPLIILTGYPCSGLTFRAQQLASLIEQMQDGIVKENPGQVRYKVKIVETHSESNSRSVYDDARLEKETRAVVYGHIKRALGRDTIVISDGMNYIKGWRYQLWCEAKAAGTTSCVVHVGTPISQCVSNNESRIQSRKSLTKLAGAIEHIRSGMEEVHTVDSLSKHVTSSFDEEPYSRELLDNLIYRYEEPSASNRWDRPLFVVPWIDERPQVGEIWTALMGIPDPRLAADNFCMTIATRDGKDNMSEMSCEAPLRALRRMLPSRRKVLPKVVQHQATAQPAATDPGALHILEKRTSDIVTAIRDYTLRNPSVGAALARCDANAAENTSGLAIQVPSARIPIFVSLKVLETSPAEELAGAGGILSLPRLQRIRRQWISMNRAYVGQGHSKSKCGIVLDQEDSFVRFLNSQLEGNIGPQANLQTSR